jgi:hypothetical protein
MSFWDTLAGQIAAWSAAVAGAAAAVRGLLYLARATWEGAKRTQAWARRAVLVVNRLLELGDEASWPNGAHTLPEALSEVYDRQGATHALVATHLGESRQAWTHHLEEWHAHNVPDDADPRVLARPRDPE